MADVQLGIQISVGGTDAAKVAISGVSQGIKNVSTAAKDASNASNDMAAAFSKGMAGLAKAYVGVQGIQALSDAFRSAIKIADDFAGVTARMNLVAKSSMEMATAMNAVFQTAQNARAPLAETAQLYYRLAAAGSQLGLTQKDTLTITDLVAKSMKISGASATETAAALQQFSQAMQAGKLNGDEFRSVSENAARVVQALTDSLKVDIGTLREWSAQGKLTTDVVAKALIEQADAINRDFGKIPITVEGAVTQLKNSIEVFIGKAGEVLPIGKMLSSMITEIANALKNMADQWHLAFPTTSTADQIGVFEKRIGELKEKLREMPKSWFFDPEEARRTEQTIIDMEARLADLRAQQASAAQQAGSYFTGVAPTAAPDPKVQEQAQRLLEAQVKQRIAAEKAGYEEFKTQQETKLKALEAETAALRDNAKLQIDQTTNYEQAKILANDLATNLNAKLEEERKIRGDLIELQAYVEGQTADAYASELARAKEINLTDAEQVTIKTAIAQAESNIRQLEQDRAQLDIDMGEKGRQISNDLLERKAKEQEFIQKINDDLKFQAELYTRLQAAQQAGANADTINLMKNQAESTRTLPQNVSADQINVLQEKVTQIEAYKTKIDELAETNKKVEESQLRLNQAWDQSVQRMQEFASIWERVLGTQSKGFAAITVSISKYEKQLNQINRDKKAAMDDKYLTAAQKESAASAAQYDSLAATFAMAADVTDMMKNMFEEGSAGYKELETLSKAAAIASQALSIAKAVEAVMAALAEGDPYTAIPRALAVAAMAVSFLSNIGATLNGGGSAAMTGQDYSKAQDQKFTQYNATALGSSDVSNSILDALDTIAGNSTADLDYSKGMARNLEIISNALAGVGAAVAQSFKVNVGLLNLGSKNTPNMSGARFDGGLDPVTNMLFGSTKISRELAGQGLEIMTQGLKKIFDTGFVKAREYVDVLVTKKSSALFGLLKSESQKIETNYSKASDPVIKALSDTFKGIYDSFKDAANLIGSGGDAFMSELNSLKVKIGRIPLGPDGKKNAEKITAAISAQADRWAAQLFPQFKEFQQVGEGMYQTAMRMTTAISAVEGKLSQLGITAASYTTLSDAQKRASDVEAELVRNSLDSATSLEDVRNVMAKLPGTADDLIAAYKGLLGIKNDFSVMGLGATQLSQDMINAAGGIANLKNATADFLERFMSPSDKITSDWKSMSDSFAQLGLTMPTTKEGFKNLVLSLKNAGAGSDKLLGSLMNLEGSFADLVEATDQAAQDAKDNILSIYQGQIDALDAAKSKLVSAYNSEKSAIQQTIDKMTSLGKTLRQFVAGLETSTNSPGNPQSRYLAAKSQFQSTFGRAMAGDADAQAQLQSQAQTLLETSRQYNASNPQYAQDYQMVSEALLKMAAQADTAATQAQQQLDAMTRQVSLLVDLNTGTQSVENAIQQVNAAQNTLNSSSIQIANTLLSMGLVDKAGYEAIVAGGIANTQAIISALGQKNSADLAQALANFQNTTKAPGNAANNPTGNIPTGGDNGAAARAQYEAEKQAALTNFQNRINSVQSKINWNMDHMNPLLPGYDPHAAEWKQGEINNLNALIDEINNSVYGLSVTNKNPAGGRRNDKWTVAFRARGGLAMGPTVVGENGPELIDFRSPVNVMSNGNTTSTLAGLADAIKSSDQNQTNVAKAHIKTDQAGYQALLDELKLLNERMAVVESGNKLARAM